MVAVAGAVAEAVAGAPWGELIQRMILEPLNMTNTFVTVDAAIETGDYAIPVVQMANGSVVQLPANINVLLDVTAPAGIIQACTLRARFAI